MHTRLSNQTLTLMKSFQKIAVKLIPEFQFTFVPILFGLVIVSGYLAGEFAYVVTTLCLTALAMRLVPIMMRYYARYKFYAGIMSYVKVTSNNIQSTVWSWTAGLGDLGVWELGDYITLAYHGVDCFVEGHARFSFVVHAVARFLRSSHDTTFVENYISKWTSYRVVAQADGEDESESITQLVSRLLFRNDRKTGETLRAYAVRASLARSVIDLFKICKNFFVEFTQDDSLRTRFESYMTQTTVYVSEKPKAFSAAMSDEIGQLEREGHILKEVFARAEPGLKRTIPTAFLSRQIEFHAYFESVKSIIARHVERIDPVSVLMGTESRRGKSTLKEQLLVWFLEYRTGRRYEEVQHLHYEYSRNANARCDNMTADHLSFGIDDTLQTTNIVEKSAEAVMTCRICSSDPYAPDQAAMSNKRTFVKPEFVVGTTNQEIHDSSSIGIEKTEAYTRRWTYIIEMPPIRAVKDDVTLEDFDPVLIKYYKGVRVDRVVTVAELIKLLREEHVRSLNKLETKKKIFERNREFVRDALAEAEVLQLAGGDFGPNELVVAQADEERVIADDFYHVVVTHAGMKVDTLVEKTSADPYACFFTHDFTHNGVHYTLGGAVPIVRNLAALLPRQQRAVMSLFVEEDNCDGGTYYWVYMSLLTALPSVLSFYVGWYFTGLVLSLYSLIGWWFNELERDERADPHSHQTMVKHTGFIVTLCFILWIVYRLRRKDDESVIAETAEKRPERAPKRKPNPTVAVAQVSIDKQTDQVLTAIKPNIGYIQLVSDTMPHPHVQNCLGIAGRNIIFNRHLLIGFEDDPTAKLTLWRPNVRIPVYLKDCKLTNVTDDVIMCYHPKFGDYRNIITHFSAENDLPTASVGALAPSMFVSRMHKSTLSDGDADLIIQLCKDHSYSTNRVGLELRGTHSGVYLRGFYNYPINTDGGDCGGVYLSMNPSRQAKIEAIHNASAGPAQAIAKPIFRREVEAALTIDHPAQMDEELYTAQTGVRLLPLGPETTARADKTPAGICFFGVSEKKHLTNRVSKIRPSPMQRRRKPTTVVAHRTPWLKNGRLVIPVNYFFNKTAHPLLVDRVVIDEAIRNEEFRYNGPSQRYESVLSDHQALNGVDFTNITPIRLDTSAGIRWSHFCVPGQKTPYLLVKEDGQIALSKVAQRDVDARIACLRKGPVPKVAKDDQKDERYPLNREEKYRVVSTDDVADLIIAKKYFGPLLDVLRATRPFGKSQVGIDAAGPMFNLLYHYLKEMGVDAIELDGSGWDLVLPYEVLEGFVRFAEAWFALHYPNEDPGNAGIRRNIMYSYLVHYHAIGDLVYCRIGGMLSGCFATAEINGFCNRTISRAIFQSVCPEREFDDCVRSVYYGDDMLATVSPDCPEFNQVTFSRKAKELFGMTWTTAAKQLPTERYLPLDEANFISRSFLRHSRLAECRFGVLSKDTIREIPLWVRTKNVEEAPILMRQAMLSSLREMVFHGKKPFRKWLAECNQTLVEVGMEPISLTYSGLIREWKEKI